jgi:hypothetical protein
MGFFKKIISSKIGIIAVSIIWGLGLAALFQRACHGKNCIIKKAPHPDNIRNKVFQFEDKCYKFEPKTTTCDKVEENNIEIDTP